MELSRGRATRLRAYGDLGTVDIFEVYFAPFCAWPCVSVPHRPRRQSRAAPAIGPPLAAARPGRGRTGCFLFFAARPTPHNFKNMHLPQPKPKPNRTLTSATCF